MHKSLPAAVFFYFAIALFTVNTAVANPGDTLAVIASGTNATRCGKNDCKVTALVSGGTAPYYYLWTTGDGFKTVSIAAQKDNSIYEDPPGYSNGAGEYMVGGTTGSFVKIRALMAFNASQFIPPAAVIAGARLTLHVSLSSGASGVQQHLLHKMMEDWGEGGSDASSSAGRGAPATVNDATWLKNFYPNSNWSKLGGFFADSASAAANVDMDGFYAWSSRGMVSDVQSWVDMPSSDFGWILKSNEKAPFQAKRYDSRQNATPLDRPVLTVKYVSNSIGNTAGLSNLAPGTYTVVVTDATGNITTAKVTITAPPPTKRVITDTTVCGPYYVWPVNNKTYTASVADTVIAGCQVNILHLAISKIAATVMATDILCYGGKTSATVIASGGIAPYTFSLGGGAARRTNTYTNLSAGSRTVTVKDKKGCVYTTTFTVMQPDKLKLAVIGKTAPSCIGESNGAVQLGGSGGVSPYQYGVNSGTYTPGTNFTDLPGGDYWFMVKDTNGCVATRPFTLNARNVECFAEENPGEYSKLTYEKNANFVIAPNPGTSYFTLTVQRQPGSAIRLEVADLYGRKVYQIKKGYSDSYRFGENFAKGIYFVSVIRGNDVQTKKIIKQ